MFLSTRYGVENVQHDSEADAQRHAALVWQQEAPHTTQNGFPCISSAIPCAIPHDSGNLETLEVQRVPPQSTSQVRPSVVGRLCLPSLPILCIATNCKKLPLAVCWDCSPLLTVGACPHSPPPTLCYALCHPRPLPALSALCHAPI